MIRFSRIVAVAAFALSFGAGVTVASAETTAPAAQGVNPTAPLKKATKEAETAKNQTQDQRPQHHAAGKDQSATASPAAGHATPSQQPAVTQ